MTKRVKKEKENNDTPDVVGDVEPCKAADDEEPRTVCLGIHRDVDTRGNKVPM